MGSKMTVAAFAAVLLWAGAASAAPAPLANYGVLPTLDKVVISPDGNTIAYVKGVEGKRAIVIQSLNGKEPPIAVDASGRKVRWLDWADATHLIITTSVTGRIRGLDGKRSENYMAQSYDLHSKKAMQLLEHVRGTTTSLGSVNVVAGRAQGRTIDGRAYVFVPGVYFPGGKFCLGLFRVDLVTGESLLVSPEGRLEAENWVVDAAGNILAEEDMTRYTQHYKLVLYRDGKPGPTVMDVAAPIEGPGVAGLKDDGTALILQMPPTVEGNLYQEISLKDGSAKPWRPELAKVGSLLVDTDTNHVVGASNDLDRTDYILFDPKRDALWRSLKASFPTATNLELTSESQDHSKVVVKVFGPTVGNGYYLVDMTTKRAIPVGAEYDGISEFYEEKWISYKAADGRTIWGYLTLPNREAKNLPLVVLPHGGPFARDEPGFDFFSQSVASRGYAVLQPQYRGSAGFGRELLEAGFHEYGKKMQTDLSDGVRALAAQGLIDPKRVCIFGHSYGGYASLAGATIDTGIYRCAVSSAGPSDMRVMLKGWPKPTMGATGARFWDRFVGIEDGDLSKADAVSPARMADKVTIPVMLIHGTDDTRVPPEQSDIMADALKSAGKPYEYVKLEGEDHHLSKSETRTKFLEAAVGFIEKHNPAQ